MRLHGVTHTRQVLTRTSEVIFVVSSLSVSLLMIDVSNG